METVVKFQVPRRKDGKPIAWIANQIIGGEGIELKEVLVWAPNVDVTLNSQADYPECPGVVRLPDAIPLGIDTRAASPFLALDRRSERVASRIDSHQENKLDRRRSECYSAESGSSQNYTRLWLRVRQAGSAFLKLLSMILARAWAPLRG